MKSNLKQRVLLCLLGCLALNAWATAKSEKLTILGTSDVHGRIYAYDYAQDEVDNDAGYAKLATLIKQEKLNDPNALLMDMGDTVQDNSAELFNDLPVHPMIEAINTIGFDVWTLGNHEFNFGMSFLNRNIAAFNGAVLSANIYKKGGKERFVEGYHIFDINGVRVAVIGMTPPHVPIWEASTPSHFAGLEFTGVINETGKAIKELEGKYDILVGAYHIGPEGEHGYKGIEAVAEAYPEFDVIFGGHAHTQYQNEVNGVKLIEPGKYGWALAKAEIEFNRNDGKINVVSVSTQNVETAKVIEDKDILNQFSTIHHDSIADANIVIGEVMEDFVKRVDYITGESIVTTMPTCQVEDSALIDLINEVQLYFTKADISSAAAFRKDMNLTKGEFKKKNLADIYKFPNTLVGVKITGENLKKYMEWSVSYYNTYKPGDVTISFDENIRAYNYDMFAGIDYEIDISKTPGNRIVNAKIKGRPIKDKKIYKLAVNNYRMGTLINLGLIEEKDKYYDAYDKYQDNGRIRDLIGSYVNDKYNGKLSPKVDNNWKIIGAPDLDHPRRGEVYSLLKSGALKIPSTPNGRTINIKSLNIYDLINEGILPK